MPKLSQKVNLGKTINLSKLDFKSTEAEQQKQLIASINLSKLDFKYGILSEKFAITSL